MKKLFVTMFALGAMVTASQAQEVKTETAKVATPMQAKLSKEQKEAALLETFKKAGVTDDQQKKVREIMDAANEKSKPIKKDATLPEAEKKDKLDQINADKNAKLKEALGDKYKAFINAKKEIEAAMSAKN